MTTAALTRPGRVRGRAGGVGIRILPPLIPILGMQLAVSLLTLHNSAFQDEGLYLYAGRLLVRHWLGGPAPLDHYAYYFSGYPYVYPVIGGVLDLVGGLELARSFSLACMLGVTASCYFITKKLFQRPAAVFASAAYASTGVVLFLGRLATFDAMCLFLIAMTAAMAVHGGMSNRPWSTLALGPVLVLAILTKYAALLFVAPVLGLLTCVSIASLGWWRAIVRLALTLTTTALSLGAAYEIIDKTALHAISGSTTHRVVGLQAPRVELVTHILQMGGLLYLLGLSGLILLIVAGKRMRLVALLLFLSSLLAPAYHVYMREPISLDKHIAYALFFAMPLVGYALAWLSGYAGRLRAWAPRAGWLAGAAVVLAVLTLGLRQAHTLYSNWANTSRLSYALHTQLRDGSGRVFAEDIEVARYDARDVTEQWQWNSFYYPYYIDANHHVLLGDPAMIAAIRNRYYDFVELSFNYFPAKAYWLAGQMAMTRNYDLIAIVPLVNSYGRGHFYLWRTALVPGGGHFRSLAQLKTNIW